MNTPDSSGWRRRTQAGIAGSTIAGLEIRNDTQRGSINSPAANPSRSAAEPGARRRAPISPPSSRSMISADRSSCVRRLPLRPSLVRGRWECRQHVLVEEMGEWPVSHVVEQARDAQRLHDEPLGRDKSPDARSDERSVGYSARAQSPASCITPRPWVNRLCSAVGNTQRALWSWLTRRRRCIHAVSSRSSSAASSGGRPASRASAGVARLVSST